jgi:hypothetical protein
MFVKESYNQYIALHTGGAQENKVISKVGVCDIRITDDVKCINSIILGKMASL